MDLSQASLMPVGAVKGLLFLIWGGHPHCILLIPWSAECKSSAQETRGEMETKAGIKQYNLQNHIQLLAFSARGRSGPRD